MIRAAVLFGFIALAAGAQPSFEVASVKPSAPIDTSGPLRSAPSGCRGGPGTNDPAIWTCSNMSLSRLILLVYNLKPYQLTGPAWLDGDRFDIVAKVPAGASKDELQLMEQNLLAGRFKMTLHREQKELPIYEMTVAKNGPKLKEVPPGPPVPRLPPPSASVVRPGAKPVVDKDGLPVLPPGWTGFTTMGNQTRMGLGNASMERLAGSLTGFSGRPVVDATGLTGRYDIVLTWTAEQAGAPMTASADGGSSPAAPASEPGPTLVQAIQEQLGLRLESKKGPVDVVVIDHAEKKPIEN